MNLYEFLFKMKRSKNALKIYQNVVFFNCEVV